MSDEICCWHSHSRNAVSPRSVKCTKPATHSIRSVMREIDFHYCARHAVAAKHISDEVTRGRVRRRS